MSGSKYRPGQPKDSRGATHDLMALLDDVPVTFDPARNITKPCFFCGTVADPRHLVAVGQWTRNAYGGMKAGDAITRPLCQECIDVTEPKK